MFQRASLDAAFQQDPTITSFIDNYRKLPLVTRAKLEKWSIDPKDVVICEWADLDNSDCYPNATFHGLDVAVRIVDKRSSSDPKTLQVIAELRALSLIRHPNVNSLIGVCFSSQSCMIVTECTRHGSLQKYVDMQSSPWRPSKARVLSWSLDLVRALNYLHNSEPIITHGNIQPTTLLVSSSLTLKLSGFGHCSSFADGCESSDEPAAVGADLTLVDSPPPWLPPPREAPASRYAAPELHRSPRIANHRADVFSAAMVIWFLRTGQHAPDHKEVRHSLGQLRWDGLGRALQGAWAELASERPEAAALQDALEGLGTREGCLRCHAS